MYYTHEVIIIIKIINLSINSKVLFVSGDLSHLDLSHYLLLYVNSMYSLGLLSFRINILRLSIL